MVNDAISFFEGKGIYHKPYFKNGRHYVAGECLTDEQLYENTIRILNNTPLKTRIDGKDFQIARYYISDICGQKNVVDIWVETNYCDTRAFLCELIGEDGKVFFHFDLYLMTYSLKEKSKSNGKCYKDGCDKPAKHVLSGLFTSVSLCDEHNDELSKYINND